MPKRIPNLRPQINSGQAHLACWSWLRWWQALQPIRNLLKWCATRRHQQPRAGSFLRHHHLHLSRGRPHHNHRILLKVCIKNILLRDLIRYPSENRLMMLSIFHTPHQYYQLFYCFMSYHYYFLKHSLLHNIWDKNESKTMKIVAFISQTNDTCITVWTTIDMAWTISCC